MKKLATVLLIAVLVLSAVSATGVAESYNGMKKVYFLNTAFEGQELSDQCYNAKEYHKAYNLGDIIDDNFWFTPAADTKALTVAYTDFYTDSNDLSIFRQKFVSFVKDNPAYDYDLFVGQQQKESYDVNFKGYCIVDKEGLVFVPEDGWNVKELFDNVEMMAADSYDFVSVSGEKVTVKAADLAGCKIELHEKDCADLSGAASLEAVQYIIPAGLTKDSTPAATGVSRLTILLTANGVYKTEAPYLENRAGTFYKAWSIAEMLEKFDITPCKEVKVISWKDGYAQKESYDLFSQKYMAFQAPTAKGDQKDFFTLGKVQARNTGVTSIGYLVFQKEAFAYIPEAGLKMADLLKNIGMDAALYKLVYADGTELVVRSEKVEAMEIAQDTTLVAIELFI